MQVDEQEDKCPTCGSKDLGVTKYDRIWGTAVLRCNKCGSKVRDMDFD